MASDIPTPPRLKIHPTGQWFCKWGGRFHYFGKDQKAAQAHYLDSLRDWVAWRQARRMTARRITGRPVIVVDLVTKFLESKEAEGGITRRRHYESHLRRFNNAWANIRADVIRAPHLQALKEDMIRAGYHPRTIGHDLSSIKSLFLWASGMELIPPVDMRFVKPPALPPTIDKSLTIKQVQQFISGVPNHIRPWLAINYLAMMRPSEVVRVVHGQGEWEKPWLFRCHGKSSGRTQEFGRIVFSDAALAWLHQCEPRWTRRDSYYRAVERSGAKYAPHPLRHSGATHLAALGVPRAEIDLLLGHLPPRVSRTYVRIDWRSLRRIVGRLTLKLSG